MTAQQKIDKMIAALEAGKTLFVNSYTQGVKVSPRTLKNYRDAGWDLFKAGKNNNVLMARGKHYDLIDGCNVVAVWYD